MTAGSEAWTSAAAAVLARTDTEVSRYERDLGSGRIQRGWRIYATLDGVDVTGSAVDDRSGYYTRTAAEADVASYSAEIADRYAYDGPAYWDTVFADERYPIRPDYDPILAAILAAHTEDARV